MPIEKEVYIKIWDTVYRVRDNSILAVNTKKKFVKKLAWLPTFNVENISVSTKQEFEQEKDKILNEL